METENKDRQDAAASDTKRIVKYTELIEAQEEYIDLLLNELEETASIAHNHGWRSHLVDEGERVREKINKLKSDITLKS